jgi:Holliday junction resolvase RusA-like endonuclease
MSARFTAFIPGKPAAQGGTVPFKKGDVYRQVTKGSKGLGSWRTACTKAFKLMKGSQGIHEPIKGPLGFRCTFFCQTPQRELTKKSDEPKQPWADTALDMDKMIRAIWDSLTQAEVIEDDKRICRIKDTDKLWCSRSQTPGVRVEVWQLPPRRELEQVCSEATPTSQTEGG